MTTPALSETTLRVRYADTDKMGVVYYANYLVWFEVARTEWLRDRGWTYHEMEASGAMLPVINAHCEYLWPARYDEVISLKTTGMLHSPVRVEFTYEVFILGNDSIKLGNDTIKEDRTLSARGSTMHCAVDVQGRPTRLPERVREVFA